MRFVAVPMPACVDEYHSVGRGQFVDVSSAMPILRALREAVMKHERRTAPGGIVADSYTLVGCKRHGWTHACADARGRNQRPALFFNASISSDDEAGVPLITTRCNPSCGISSKAASQSATFVVVIAIKVRGRYATCPTPHSIVASDTTLY